ncbi:DUF6572 domain-containing protein [Mesorhizobium sp. M0296]|uniref:DUF6572 domain-containing protein n=1 Tax=Mesorhizobium sp. M0296 TaxID=2956931 RepID=UPI00333AD49F
MAVQHTDVVDIVAKGKNGEYLLSIVDDLDWDDVENHLVLLENKLNLYCVFVLDGLQRTSGCCGATRYDFDGIVVYYASRGTMVLYRSCGISRKGRIAI